MTKSLVFAVLTLAFGGVGMGLARFISAEVRRKIDWPTVPGQILERGVGEAMSTRGPNFLPRIKVRYAVGEKEFTGDQVYLIRGTGNTAPAVQSLVDGLPNPVPVHYDPENPADSYLIATPMSTYWILIAFSGGALLLGALQLLTALTKKS